MTTGAPGEPTSGASPMEQLSRDPELGPMLGNLRGEKLYQALKARLGVENNPTRRRLIEELLKDRRWFLEPLGKAPTLSRVNGIGTSILGESERDSDGTYVTTLFFTFLFIPIVPIAQYLVRSLGGRKYQFFGKVPFSQTMKRWRQALALGIAATAVLAGVGLVEHQGHSDVWFVNGLDVPVKIQAKKLDVTVPPNGREMRRLARGPYDLKITTADGRLLDEDRVTIPGATDVVAYNVLGAAPLFKQPVTYYAEGHEGTDKDEPIIQAGKKLIVEDDIDYVFSEPPKTIEMSEGQNSVRHWRFDTLQGNWKLGAAALVYQKRPEEAARVAEAVATAFPDDLNNLQMASTILYQTRGPDGARVFAEKLADKYPDKIEVQRLYQGMMEAMGRRAELVKRYQEREKQHPDSPVAGYLAARMELPSEAAPHLQALAKRFPDDVYIRRALAWSLLNLRQFNDAAAEFERELKLPHEVEPKELEGVAQAFLGAGRRADAAKTVAAHGDDNAILYARVAHAVGKDAPYPPDHFAKEGTVRAWYEANFGDPDQIEKLIQNAAVRAAYHVTATARKSADQALAVIDKLEEENALGNLDRPLAFTLAAWSIKRGDQKRAARILDEMAPAATAAERAAVLEGKDSPELAADDLDELSALELARAWRIGDKKLVDRAKADDLLHGAVTTALAWK